MGNPISSLLLLYGAFLICAGIASVALIGKKAKTALLSGGTAGSLALTCAYLCSKGVWLAPYAASFLCFGLFMVFSWRASKTLFKLFELLQSGEKTELQSKGKAFLIISLMAIISLFCLFLLGIALI